MVKYMKERKTDLLIRDRGSNYLLEYYDKASGKWVEDFDLCKIYDGSILVDTIPEKEAKLMM